jgi:heat shock protein HslJ
MGATTPRSKSLRRRQKDHGMSAFATSRRRALKSFLAAVVGAGAGVAPGAARAGAGWDGSTWLVEDIRRRGVIDNAQTTLRIEADGAVSGSTGCNAYSGSAKIDGDAIRFGPLAVAARACVPALADQERKFLHALSLVRARRLDRFGRLQLVSAQGEALLTLTRM